MFAENQVIVVWFKSLPLEGKVGFAKQNSDEVATNKVLIMIKTLSDLINSVDHKIVCEHWHGEDNAIEVITDLARLVAENLNKEKIAAKVASFFDSLKKNNRG